MSELHWEPCKYDERSTLAALIWGAVETAPGGYAVAPTVWPESEVTWWTAWCYTEELGRYGSVRECKQACEEHHHRTDVACQC